MVTLTLVLTGCSSGKISSIYNDDKEIASVNNSYNLNDSEQQIDNQKFTGTVEFEGMDTIWKFDSENDVEIDMTYLLKISQGKAKLVLISPDGTLTTLIETNKDSEVEDYAVNTLFIKEGVNKIKLVAADKANIEFDINIDYGTFSELGF